MKKILFAALTALLLVAVCVIGLVPALSRNEDGVIVADQLNAAGATVNAEQIKTAMSTKETAPEGAVAVGTAAQWAAMTSGGTYKLTADITVSGSLGTAEAPFGATIYGDGHTVTASAPLFANAGTIGVYDLTVAGTISGNGAVAGEATSLTAKNVTVTAAVTGTGAAGGLVGTVGTVNANNCLNLGAVKGGSIAGGLVGSVTASATLQNCSNGDDTFAASVTATDAVGGLVGTSAGDSLTVTNCVNYISLTIATKTTENYVGGMVGKIEANTAKIELCSNAGVISGPTSGDDSKKSGYGGMVGLAKGTSCALEIKDCLNIANVTISGAATNHNGVGGILGFDMCRDLTVTGCVNMGNVGTAGANINPGSGGIVGEIEYADQANPKTLTVKDCVNSGNVVARRAGGIIGVGETFYGVALIENCSNSGAINSIKNYGAGIVARLDPKLAATEEVPYTITVKNCTNNGTVNTEAGGSKASGIYAHADAGASPIKFENCTNNATITNTMASGIASLMNGRATFVNCVNNGTIIGSGSSGGIAARVVLEVNMTDCTNHGDVTVSAGHAAGICAEPYGKQNYLRCTNNGDMLVTATSGSYDAGGISGRGWTDRGDGKANRDGTSFYTDCVNTGNITNRARMAGGIAGWNDCDSTFTNCVNTGNVTGITNVGGMAGQVTWKPVVTSCINMGYIEGGQIVGGFLGSGCSDGHGGAKFVGNVNTGNVHNTGAKSTDKSHGAGGICGYIYGVGNFYYNAVTGDVTGNFPTNRTTLYDKSACAAICGYQNNNSGEYIFNYFTGTLDAKNGTNVLLKVTPGDTACLCDNSTWGSTYLKWNYTTTDYPFYTEGGCTKNPGSVIFFDPNNSAIHNQHMVYEGWLVTAEDVANGNLLNTLNTVTTQKVAGFPNGAYVQVTICDKVNLPIFNGTAELFEQWCDIEHEYTELKTDADAHWYECTCGEVSPEGKLDHENIVKTDAINHWTQCSVCGYTTEMLPHVLVSHYDETHHWTACEICSREVSRGEHAFDDMVPSGPYHHTYACECGATSGVEELHVYDVPKMTEEGHLMTCECGAESFAGVTAHTAGDKLYTDGEYHWNQCVCGYVMNKTEHAAAEGAKPTCQTELVCETCGVAFGGVDLNAHVKDIEWTSDKTMHYGKYPCCGVEVAGIAHVWHETENNCTVCGWVCEHEGGDATCTLLARCEHCNKEYGELDPEDHRNNLTDATCMAVAHCADCDRDYGEKNMANHAEGCVTEYILAEGNELTQHTLHYSLCHQIIETANHVVNTVADCDSKESCLVCKLEYDEKDPTNHDALCGMDHIVWDTEHENIATNHKGTYPACGQILDEKHNFNVGTCTVCNYVCVAHVNGGETVCVPTENADFAADAHDVRYACCGVKAGLEAHTYDATGKCTGCGYTCAHEGGFDYEKISETQHSKTCQSCHVVVNEAHNEKTAATCQAAAYCDLCGQSYGDKDPDAHNFAAEWLLGTEGEGDSLVYYHYHQCLNDGCPVEGSKGYCDGTATCVAKAKCSVCELEHGEIDPDAHNYDTAWLLGTKEVEGVTVYYHYHKCLNEGCEVEGSVGNCDGVATCIAKAKCSVCALERGELDASNHALETTTVTPDAENGQHYEIYDCCKVEVEGTREACAVGEGGTEATCTAKATCGECGQTFGEVNSENHTTTDTTLKSDAENGQHYYIHNCCEAEVADSCEACAVGEGGTEATCTAKATCGECGQSFGEVNGANHTTTDTTLKSDAEHGQHYYIHNCCEAEVEGSRETCAVGENGTAATCAAKAICGECGQAFGELDPSNHAGTETKLVTDDYQKHHSVYVCCPEVTVADSTVDHVFQNCVCACGFTCTHALDENTSLIGSWTKLDEEKHSRACSNCDYTEEEAHTESVSATCQSAAHCNVCNADYGEPNPTAHSWSEEYTVEDERHYKTCTLGCGAINEEGVHVYDRYNVQEDIHWLECICGKENPENSREIHDMVDKFDENNHWSICECGKSTEVTAHDFTYVKDEKGHLEQCACGVTRGTVVEHSFNAETGLCTVCEYECTHTGEHTYVTDTEVADVHDVLCIACGKLLENDVAHSYDDGHYVFDENSHWVACLCGVKQDAEGGVAHTGGTATCKDQALCEVCGAPYGELDPENHATPEVFDYWVDPEDLSKHVKAYDCCGTKIGTEAHSYEGGVCKDCEADCVHTGGTATCKDKAVCTVCNTPYGELAPTNHTYGEWKVTTAPTTEAKGVETRTCTGCGATETRDVAKLTTEGGSSSDSNADHSGDNADTDKDGLSTGAIVAIVAGSIIAVGIIVALIVWFTKGRSATADAESATKPWRTKKYRKPKWKKRK